MSGAKRYWIPVKTLGWGFPRAWQGLAVMLAWFVAVGIVFRPPEESHVLRWLGYVVAITAVLMAICWKKGELSEWRWGSLRFDRRCVASLRKVADTCPSFRVLG